jgi:hypothetical protein
MFMKTNDNETDKLASPTIFMKINDLSFLDHDIYEKAGT